jgi:hypothetical protein
VRGRPRMLAYLLRRGRLPYAWLCDAIDTARLRYETTGSLHTQLSSFPHPPNPTLLVSTPTQPTQPSNQPTHPSNRPGVFVHSIATGDGEYHDVYSSFMGNVNDQVGSSRRQAAAGTLLRPHPFPPPKKNNQLTRPDHPTTVSPNNDPGRHRLQGAQGHEGAEGRLQRHRLQPGRPVPAGRRRALRPRAAARPHAHHHGRPAPGAALCGRGFLV